MSYERGRRGATVLALPSRPQPPEYFTDDEQQVWRQTVESLPQDWFRPETLPLLEFYCTHVVRRRKITARIRAGKLTKDKLSADIDLELRETKMVAHLATKMRLTQQSSFDRSRSKRSKSSEIKPWMPDGEDD